jgi:hypothetical protein
MVEPCGYGKPSLEDFAQGFPFIVIEVKQFWHTGTLANPLLFLKVKTKYKVNKKRSQQQQKKKSKKKSRRQLGHKDLIS